MERPAIRLRGVGCTIDGRALLKDIKWDIEPGSRWVVFGSNGCGKTTLLSIIAGYGSYSSGSVKVGDAELKDMDAIDWRMSVGFVSGSFFGRIYQNETVLHVLTAGTHGTMGTPLEEVTPQEMRIIRKLLASRGLEHRLDSPFVTLSKGEQQIILVLRALLLNTQTLLLDEPMSGLDVAARAEMQHMLFTLADKRQATMVYVSHHLEEISPELFDNCLLLSRGRVQASGPIREVLSSDAARRIIGRNPYAQDEEVR